MNMAEIPSAKRLNLRDTDCKTILISDWVAFDTETWLIAPGRAAPRMVCGSFCDNTGQAEVLHREDALDIVEHLLATGTTIVGQNIVFDMAVVVANRPRLLVPVFRAFEKGLILSIDIIEKLRKIARGWNKFDHRFKSKPRYSLEEMVYQYLDEKMTGKKGDDVWRLRYRELDNVAVCDWPAEAYNYAKDDAILTARVFQMQQSVIPSDVQFKQTMVDLRRQMMAAWGLYLMRVHGFRTDGLAVDMLEHELHGRVDGEIEYLIEAGIYRYEGPKKDPKRKKVRCMDVIQERVRIAFEGRGEDCPMTEGGKGEVKNPKPKTDAETLEKSMDKDLGRLADIMGDKKLLDTYIPVLKQGVLWPINPYYNVLVDSGRTSCSKPNVQNQPRAGGVRESFIPRPGHVYVGCDYHTAELRSLAQYCLEVLGVSEMAKALEHTEKYPHGKDLHLVMASNLLRQDYDTVAARLKAGDKEVKDARQISKALNFGYPGGLGAAKFLEFAWASYRMKLADTEHAAIKEAKNLKKLWMEAFPEMRLFFDHISSLSGGADSCTMHLIKSGRVRGDVGYTEACNTVFQSLTADGAKLAVWATVKESWTGYLWNEPIPDDATDISTASPLLGYRPNGFVHDEIIGESPLPLYRQHAKRLADVMKEAMCWFVDRVPVEAEAHVMRRWWKDAEPTFNEHGELIPWSPKNPHKVLAKLQKDHPLIDQPWGTDSIAELERAFPDTKWKSLHRAWMLDELAKDRTGENHVPS